MWFIGFLAHLLTKYLNMHLKELQREKSIGETGEGTKDYSSFEYVQRNEVHAKRVSWKEKLRAQSDRKGEREQEKKEVSK